MTKKFKIGNKELSHLSQSGIIVSGLSEGVLLKFVSVKSCCSDNPIITFQSGVKCGWNHPWWLLLAGCSLNYTHDSNLYSNGELYQLKAVIVRGCCLQM